MSRGSNPTKVEQWSDRLKRFESSSETVTQFCLAEGVSQPSFYQWKKKLGTGKQVRGGTANRAKRPNRRNRDEPTFKPIQLTPIAGPPQRTTIRLADGVEIELGNNLQVVDVVVRSVVKQVLSDGAARAGGSSC
jgi:hypothetical protein